MSDLPTNHAADARKDGLALDQRIVLAALVGAAALCWWWLIDSAQLMHTSTMDAAGTAGMADMAPKLPVLPYFASALLMWVLMTVAMMVPSALPMILRHTRFTAQNRQQNGALHSLLFAACYLLVWIGFAVVAALLQTWLIRAGLVGRMALAVGSDKFAAFLLIMTALYELSPIKRACLGQCRSPLSFMVQRWRPGLAAAIRLGFAHGAYCLGCCWLLMLLLFVGGVMNLLWVALLTIIVIVEKLAPPQLLLERWLAVLMIFAALALLVF